MYHDLLQNCVTRVYCMCNTKNVWIKSIKYINHMTHSDGRLLWNAHLDISKLSFSLQSYSYKQFQICTFLNLIDISEIISEQIYIWVYTTLLQCIKLIWIHNWSHNIISPKCGCQLWYKRADFAMGCTDRNNHWYQKWILLRSVSSDCRYYTSP